MQDAAVAARVAAKASMDKNPGAYGACGFAWVTIRPARGPFVTWLKKQKIGSLAYGGGWQLWTNHVITLPDEWSQSIDIKEDACYAFAQVLRENGIDAYAGSRLD